jgi:hypothetical protein
MKAITIFLLLAASPALAAAPVVQLYTARAEGSLTIGADGRVLDVELSSDVNLGKEVLAGYEQRIRAWRFEPILENGRPVNAKGLMHLSLVAAREEGSDAATFAIRRVQFLDPPDAAADPGEARLKPPPYPMNAYRAGAGADLVLVIKLDAQGKVLSAATETLELLGVGAKQPHQKNLAAQFSRVAERTAGSWIIPGQEPDAVVRVPVRFSTERMAGWSPIAPQPLQLPEWAVLELATEQVTELSASGMAAAEQFKLLTPLDGA